MFFHCQVGSLVDHRASKPYTLVGPPSLQLVLDPLAVKLLNNGLCITTVVNLLQSRARCNFFITIEQTTTQIHFFSKKILKR